MANRNLELLKVAAKLLRPVLNELVFVGGCATGLLVSDEAAAEVRPTFDVDAICRDHVIRGVHNLRRTAS